MTVPRFYLSKEELPEATALSRSTIEEEIRQGRFPKPRLLSKQRVGYLLREVMEWAESRPVADLPPPSNTCRRKVNQDREN
ncbi:AlpA family transcriptional regulator [Pseudacidovorax sp. RU35E]|uniref:helix-turn-helix transcriptional regulator n=1 Tax=Pseudacidovorax sp. RU35E TaxID=1907403 RepID=UPI000953C9E8|nr:AlpA family phage regulatory protein [Pseudacidovorax sp. RU35E]SIR00981.1 transcriptional regulator, AlpA family [Pseudacidovorax sp. RU35E]